MTGGKRTDVVKKGNIISGSIYWAGSVGGRFL